MSGLAKRMQLVDATFSNMFESNIGCMMLVDVERSLISIKHRLKHRPTFLLFSSMNNNVAFVWTPSSTLLNARMPIKLTLRVSVSMVIIYCLYLLRMLPREPLKLKYGQTNTASVYILRILGTFCSETLEAKCCIKHVAFVWPPPPTLCNIIQRCWMMLQSFGRAFKSVPNHSGLKNNLLYVYTTTELILTLLLKWFESSKSYFFQIRRFQLLASVCKRLKCSNFKAVTTKDFSTTAQNTSRFQNLSRSG